MTKPDSWISLRTCVRGHFRALGTVMFLLAGASALEAQTVTVMWDRNPEPDVIGYVLHYGNQSRAYTTSINVGNQTSRQVSLTPGLPYYFAVQAYNTANLFSPYSAEIRFPSTAPAPPVLMDPPNRTSAAGSYVSLQLLATDANWDPLSYSASGLPPSLSINAGTGLISGTLAQGNSGTYTVTATASDGSLRDTETFTWTVTSAQSLRGDDVAMDFGASGVWLLNSNPPGASLITGGPLKYWQLHGSNPDEMATGDLDGNGQADLILDFPGLGVWVWLNNSLWFQLHPMNVASIVTGDLDGNGRSDVILDFPGSGIWVWLNNANWFQLHSTSPTRMVTGDLDGNGMAEVIIDFPGFGIWIWANNATWRQLDTANATSLAVGDLDGGGRAEVLIGFPGQGLWVWRNDSTWSTLHAATPSHMVTGDIDGNGLDEVIIDFPGYGLWVWRNDRSWSQLHTQDVEALSTGDIDGNGQADVIMDFGAPGLWTYLDDKTWIQLHAQSPQGVTTGDLDGM